MGTLLSLLGNSPYFGGGPIVSSGGGAGLVDIYSATTNGGGDIDNNVNGSFTDVAGLSVTVLGTQVGDVLRMRFACGVYSLSASNAAFNFLIDGAVARTNYVTYHATDGNADHVDMEWVTTLGAGDITASNTIVKVQWQKYSAPDALVSMTNSADGLGTLSVIRVRA